MLSSFTISRCTIMIPFDRLIIAQAISEEMAALTADSDFRKYPVKELWCGR